MSQLCDNTVEDISVKNEQPSTFDEDKLNKLKTGVKYESDHEQRITTLLDELKFETAGHIKAKVRNENYVYRGAPNSMSVYLNYDNVGPTGDTLDYDSDRNDFVRLVFLLVLFMLIYTVGIIIMFLYVSLLHDFLFTMYGLISMICASIIVLAMHYVMFCSACSRTVPCNYICLLITASCMGFVAAFITCKYETDALLIAVTVTAIIVLVCLGIACTSFDFTNYILYLIIASTIVFVLGLIFSLTTFVFKIYYKPIHIVILIVSTLVSCFGLIIELQMILGGRTVELGEDDYALGAFMLYLSIIEIFFKILALTGLLSED